jgi:16S rRNA G966 N2-methylase RsmD
LNIIITTAQRPDDNLITKGLNYSKSLDIPFIPREKIGNLSKGTTAYLVVTKEGLVCHYQNHKLFYHPSMAMLRIKGINNGNEDIFTTICGDIKGFSILDCTMGFGADSLVWSFLSGENGSITALEKNKIIYAIVSEGLKGNYSKWKEINDFARRIKPLNEDYVQFLSNCPTNTFDIVYFDPMFDIPIEKSSHLQPLRLFAEKGSLTKEIINIGKRVAKKLVIVKNNRNYDFSKIGITETFSKKSSNVKYGIIRLNKGE